MADQPAKLSHDPESGATAGLNGDQPGSVFGPAPPPHMTEKKQSVDELAEELQQNPFFMTSAHNNSKDKPNPAYEAIMALRNEGSRAEKANRSREDGNDEARAGQWREARAHYKVALEYLDSARQPEDPSGPDEDKKEAHIKQLLLANCAQCNLQLQNYRMCIKDCKAALEINPKNIKASFRMASALIAVRRLDEAEEACKMGLTFATEKAHFDLLLKRIAGQRSSKIGLETYKREQIAFQKLAREFLSKTLSNRGVRRKWTGQKLDLSGGSVKIIGNSFNPRGELGIPILVLYPVHEKSDLIKEFNERETLIECMEIIFPAPWDVKDQYNMESAVGFLETWDGKIIQWPEQERLNNFLGDLAKDQVEIVDDHIKLYLVPKKKIKAWKNSLPKDKIWQGPNVEGDTAQVEEVHSDGESVGEREMGADGEDDLDGQGSEEDDGEDDAEEESGKEWDTDEEDD